MESIGPEIMHPKAAIHLSCRTIKEIAKGTGPTGENMIVILFEDGSALEIEATCFSHLNYQLHPNVKNLYGV